MMARELQAIRRRARAGAIPAYQRAWMGGRRFGVGRWTEWLRWRSVAVRGEMRRWQAALPVVFASGFVFTLGLWVAVFSVSAAILATRSIPLHIRYGVGVAALTYLYFYAVAARFPRVLNASSVLFTVADASAVTTIYLLSASYVRYAQLLLFFVVARMAARYRDVRALPAALVLTIPFVWPYQGPEIAVVLQIFGVLTLMLGVQHMLEATSRARREAGLQSTLAAITSSLARATGEGQILDSLANLLPPLASGCAWAFWLRDPAGTDFRVERWYGLPAGARPVRNFAPALDEGDIEGVEITGPLPGTSFGEVTLIQPVTVESQVSGLIMVSGKAAEWGGGRGHVIRTIAADAGVALARVHASGDQRRRAKSMEIANRLAGLVAGYVRNPSEALDILRPELRMEVTCDSVHFEWLSGDVLEIVAGTDDPVSPFIPQRLLVRGTRAGEALEANQPLHEPVTGRRPEDVFWVAAGIRQVAVIPFKGQSLMGTLQVGRRESRPFTVVESVLLRLLAERLAIAFEAGLVAASSPAHFKPPVMTRLVTES